jgi:hypothetical protein
MAKILFLIQLQQLAVVGAAQNMKMEVLVVLVVAAGSCMPPQDLMLEALELQDKGLLVERVILPTTILIRKHLAVVVEVAQAELEPVLLLELIAKVMVVQECVQL